MKLIGNLVVIFLVILGMLALIPLASLGVGMVLGTVFALVCFVIWLAPFWIIATSEQTFGLEKIAWLLAMIFLSWFAWVFYFFLAPIKPRSQYGYYEDDCYYDYR
ncbi:MAG: hypothetical protein OXE78_10475 [Gammaproteobacteria bacterium]|nr:hypothetical protein [Gammaproteobacteria bacterium]